MTVTADEEACYVDDYLVTPIHRDDLCNAVETARRITVYNDTIEELLSLTARRRALRERLSSDRGDDCARFVRLSRRINELHSRIENTLADVEDRHSELLSGKRGKRAEDTGAGGV